MNVSSTKELRADKNAEPDLTGTLAERSGRPWLHGVLIAAMIIASLAPVWTPKYFPSQNGPWFLLIAKMFGELEDPQLNYGAYYERAWHFVPHMLHNVLVFGLSQVMPLLTAEKVALSAYVILLPLSIFYFLRVIAPDRKIVGYLAFLMVHTYSFYRGYHNFSLSVPFFFLSFAFWLQHRDAMTWRRAALMTVLSVATYLSHLVGFAILAFCIGFYRLFETRNLVKSCAAVAWTTWAGWLLFGEHVIYTANNAHWIQPGETTTNPLHTNIEFFLRKYFYTVSYPAYVIGAAAWLWIVYLIGRRLQWFRPSVSSTLRRGISDPMLALVGVLVVIYMVLPYKLVGWHPFNARMLPYIMGLMLACAGPLPVGRRGVIFRTSFLSTVCGAALAIYVLLTIQVVRMNVDIEEYVSGIEHFEIGGRLLPVWTDHAPVGQVRHLQRVYEYYHIAKGGANGSGICKYNTLVPMRYRTYPISKVFPPLDEKNPDPWMTRVAKVYDFVLLWDMDDELAKAIDQGGFKLVHSQGRLRLFRNDNFRGDGPER